FEPFFTTKPPGRGSGLGLSQVHGLAKKSGGDVRIESTQGAGTTVTLLLPRAPAGTGDGNRAANPAADTPAPVRQLRVLIVDDDPEVRLMLEDMLKALGHVALIAADAAEALSILETRTNIDLLVSDYAMPGMNGATLIECARGKRPGLHALMVTGHVELGTAAPVTDAVVLRKPFHLKDLASHIAQLVGGDTCHAARSPELNIA
ncbi:MAG: response regulator, partial [Acetobacteraceae bacterium]